jgi:ribonuclease P protein component
MRFHPDQHLRRQSDIRSAREQGQRVDCRAFTLWWKIRESPEEAPLRPRVCVIASTAAVGGATRRNRAKRRLRELFRRHQQLVPAGCDLLLVARAGAGGWPMPELEKRFAAACAQIRAPSARP